MRRIGRLSVGVLALALVALVAADARAEKLKATPVAHGSLDDVKLMKAAPKSGVITHRKGLDKLMKAWKIDKAAKVDFRKEIVLVATTRGGKLLPINANLDDGNLKFGAAATRDLKPGFRYSIVAVPREGVKKVNGKALPK
jgi:hypothetical protein